MVRDSARFLWVAFNHQSKFCQYRFFFCELNSRINKIYFRLLIKVISGPSVENSEMLLLVANQSIFVFLYRYYADATGRKFVMISKFLRWLRIPDELRILLVDIKYCDRKPCFYYGFIVIDLTMNTFYWVTPNNSLLTTNNPRIGAN